MEDIQAKVVEPIQTVVQKLEGWLDAFIGMLPNIAVTLLLLIIFLVLANLGGKLFKKILCLSVCFPNILLIL